MAFVPSLEAPHVVVAVATTLVAGFGPVTSTVEDVATSVAAGILLGGFGAGVLGVGLGWDRRRRDEMALVVGYAVGLIMALAAVVEAIIG